VRNEEVSETVTDGCVGRTWGLFAVGSNTGSGDGGIDILGRVGFGGVSLLP